MIKKVGTKIDQRSRNILAFTLLETILYLALFGMIFTSIVQFGITMAENNRIAEYRNQVSRAATFITTDLLSKFKRGQSITAAQSIFDNDVGKVVLVQPSATYTYTMASGRLTLGNGTVTDYISSPDVTVTQFRVEPVYTPAPASALIGARITLGLRHSKSALSTQTLTSFYTWL
jgi:hypothetical protein